ncbi:MAG: N-acetyl sugar amidotransferase [Pseudomonadota bacterium]
MGVALQQAAGLGGEARICAKTVMDTSDPDIRFDEAGVCHYWRAFETFRQSLPSAEDRALELDRIAGLVRAAGRGRSHDCVLGLSGGVDSSYLALVARDLGLRPLLVHFDNGWNTERAVSNIDAIASALGAQLETYVMDWPAFRDLQRAYFKASVVDLEVPTDHMIFGALHQIAARRGIRHILSGANFATEWLMPASWNYRKQDLVNLLAIHQRFGEQPLRRLPKLGLWQQAWYHHARRVRTVAFLDLVPYEKGAAAARLEAETGWRDYGGKHHESVFTRFYQGYVLPRKFGIDKRKAHLSNQIMMGAISREAALDALAQPPYDPGRQQRDKAYVAKKLGFSEDAFEGLLDAPGVPHARYGTDAPMRRRYMAVMRWAGRARDTIRRRSSAA